MLVEVDLALPDWYLKVLDRGKQIEIDHDREYLQMNEQVIDAAIIRQRADVFGDGRMFIYFSPREYTVAHNSRAATLVTFTNNRKIFPLRFPLRLQMRDLIYGNTYGYIPIPTLQKYFKSLDNSYVNVEMNRLTIGSKNDLAVLRVLL